MLFTVKFRGYSREEVDDFLDQLVRDYGGLIEEKQALEADCQSLREELSKLEALKEKLTDSIQVVQKIKTDTQRLADEKEQEILFSAKKEANQLLLTAKKEADNLLYSAEIENRVLKSNIIQMSSRATNLHAQLKELLTEQLTLLENEQWEKIPQDLTEGLIDISEKSDKQLIKLSETKVSPISKLNYEKTLDEANALLKKLD